MNRAERRSRRASRAEAETRRRNWSGPATVAAIAGVALLFLGVTAVPFWLKMKAEESLAASPVQTAEAEVTGTTYPAVKESNTNPRPIVHLLLKGRRVTAGSWNPPHRGDRVLVQYRVDSHGEPHVDRILGPPPPERP